MPRARTRDVIGDVLAELYEHGRGYCDSEREAFAVMQLYEVANPGRKCRLERTDWGRWVVVSPDVPESPAAGKGQ